ncbi:MAG: ferrous iron transport protein B [Candidatus Helarchaeota archaeon]|nr:ferrous iron transport protein B [Candidatus Helarchaeota archaeon]
MSEKRKNQEKKRRHRWRHRGKGPHLKHGKQKLSEEDIDFRVVLLGNPNVGKSVIFYRLTKTYVIASNFPGTSVTLTEGVGRFEGKWVRVVDTPGIYKLTPISEDERVARSVLIDENPDVVLQVADAKNLRRSILFNLQILEVGFPTMLVLNMWDELHDQKIDLATLEEILGIPVVNTIATEKTGIKNLKSTAFKIKNGEYKFKPYHIHYPDSIEIAIQEISKLLPQADLPFTQRAFSLMLLEGDRELERWIIRKYGHAMLDEILKIKKDTESIFADPLNFIITQRREIEARKITNQVVSVEETKKSLWGEKISALSIHKYWGPLILLGVLILVFLFVGYVGANFFVWVLEGQLFGRVLNPLMDAGVRFLIPNVGAGHFVIEMLVGEFGVLTVGLTWIFGLILPIVFTFFLAFAILEDSGYLSRIAVITNQFAKKMGLSGKAMIPMILGLGCGTTAHLTTRILDTRKERIIATLLVALAVPCSAQLGIMLGFITTFGFQWLLIGLGIVFLQLFVIGYLASRIVSPGEKISLMIEIPPLRVPKLENIAVKTWKRLVWFMKEVIPIFLVGIAVLSMLYLFGAEVWLESAFSPVTGNLLGLPSGSGSAFVSAIFRRDLGAAVFFKTLELNPIQATVGFTVLTLFLPCIASLIMIIKERGVKVALAIIIFVFAYAIAVGALINVILNAIIVI